MIRGEYMDWSKAKTILIIVFLILNIFLGGNLWLKNSAKGEVTIVSTKEIDEAKKILKQEGIIIEADIPKKISPQPFLTVIIQILMQRKQPVHFLIILMKLKLSEKRIILHTKKGTDSL